MKTFILFLLTLITIVSCKRTESNTQNTPEVIYSDTVINLSKFSYQNDLDNLDSIKAKKVLYDYFKSKRYLIEDELDFELYEPESPKNYGKKAIDYIGISKFKFKNKPIAIIRYYNCEPFINGSCVEPHYAIILNAQSGYKISNEEFLSPHFRIDSIKNINDNSLIFGYNFECANKKILKRYRVELK